MNPNWKPKVTLKCEVCEIEFEAFPSRKNSRFCDRKCFLKWHKTNWKISDDNRMKMLKGLLKRPTKPEQKLIDIINKHNLPFKYVGDGSLILGGLNPDFVNESDRQIIEVFGDYWHSPEVCHYVGREKVRRAIFAKLNYQTLVIWEHELENEKFVIEKISSVVNKP